jgi:hypothetical protein
VQNVFFPPGGLMGGYTVDVSGIDVEAASTDAANALVQADRCWERAHANNWLPAQDITVVTNVTCSRRP